MRTVRVKRGALFRIRSVDPDMSAKDALHLSVAVSAGIPLLTADRDLARAARRHDASATLVK